MKIKTLTFLPLLLVCAISAPLYAKDQPKVQYHQVVKVSDGDTFKLANGEKVRMIGIDTPELHKSQKLQKDAKRSGQDAATIKAMGHKVYEFVKPLLLNKEVRLEFDVQERDRYGRLLAYVYLKDGTFVNAEIIKNGYAYPMSIPPNVKYAEEFRRHFKSAQENGLGLWK